AIMKEGLMFVGPQEHATVIDTEGKYELALAPGKYQVAAAARGLARSDWQIVDLGEGGATLDFTLRAGSKVFGRVVERGSNQAIAGARVVEEGNDFNDGVMLSSEVTSASDGRFSIEGLAPGRHALNIQAAGHNGRIVSGLQVPGDGALGP